MCEDRAWREEIMGIVDVRVGVVGRVEGSREGDFGGVFGDVGLDGEVLCVGEGA